MSRDLDVVPCPASLRAAALRRLQAAGDMAQQESLAQAIAATSADDDEAWAGLFVAGGAQADAAIWVQPTAGNTALVWPPEPKSPMADELFRAAATFVDARGIRLAQMIVGPHDGFDRARMSRVGMPWLVDLLYLYRDLSGRIPARSQAAQSLQFLPDAGGLENSELLADLVERTYVGTQDCPALNDVRPVAEVLAGYRSQGRLMPQHWYRVETDDPQRRPVGALILADHPAAGNWELVYMGVLPEMRGRGIGAEMVRHAAAAAARGGAARLVLAVDAANEPALATYIRSGFVEWDRRTVYARMRRA